MASNLFQAVYSKVEEEEEDVDLTFLYGRLLVQNGFALVSRIAFLFGRQTLQTMIILSYVYNIFGGVVVGGDGEDILSVWGKWESRPLLYVSTLSYFFAKTQK